jgi:response regulator RpfG family c-di-GMP phosphodiesterase
MPLRYSHRRPISLRRLVSLIPTILVTAYRDDGARTRALNEGVVCYLRKPINEVHLIP